MTRSLLAPRCWARVLDAFRSGDRVLIGLDLDGTLAPIVRRPELAQVPSRTRGILAGAARARRVRIVIVSARSLTDMGELLPVNGIGRMGQYGLEGALAPPPRTRSRIRRSCRLAAPILARAVADIPGAWIETKGLTFAVHDRGVAPARLHTLRRAVARAVPIVRRMGFVPASGRRVTDFIPIGFDKGTALRGAVAKYRPQTVFYFGDSLSDEPAFRTMGRGDFPVRVGSGTTRARFRVADLRGVTRVLSAAIRLRARATARQRR